MDNWIFLIGMTCLWTIATGVVLALMPDDEDEQDAKRLADELEGKGQS